MVHLTVDVIARGTSGYTKKRTDESIPHFLRRLSHLYLDNKSIDEVGDELTVCRNLIVLYLYDNSLTRVPNLNGNGSLKELYLQNNEIDHIDNLAALKKLTKLYLGNNHITVVEGLEKLEMLEELHVEHQKLPPGEKLLFDPRTLAALSRTLQVLNVSGNALDSIRDLTCFTFLRQLNAADNCLTDMKEMAHVLSSCRYMSQLDLIGNPICHKQKYRDRIIIMAPSLEMFDGKEVTDTAKKFLQNWQANKDAVKRDLAAGEALPAPIKGPNAKVPGYIMPALPRKQFQDVLARSASQPNSAQFAHRTPHNGHPPQNGQNGHHTEPTSSQGSRYLNSMGTPYHEPLHGAMKSISNTSHNQMVGPSVSATTNLTAATHNTQQMQDPRYNYMPSGDNRSAMSAPNHNQMQGNHHLPQGASMSATSQLHRLRSAGSAGQQRREGAEDFLVVQATNQLRSKLVITNPR